MQTVLATVFAVAVVFTVIDAVTLYVAYRKRDVLLPRIRRALGMAPDHAVRSLIDTCSNICSRLEAIEVRNAGEINQITQALRDAEKVGAEEVIAIGKRIDDIQDSINAHVVATHGKKKVRRARR